MPMIRWSLACAGAIGVALSAAGVQAGGQVGLTVGPPVPHYFPSPSYIPAPPPPPMQAMPGMSPPPPVLAPLPPLLLYAAPPVITPVVRPSTKR